MPQKTGIRWFLTALALALGLTLNHETVRLLPVFASYPGASPLCALALVTLAIVIATRIAFGQQLAHGWTPLRMILFISVAVFSLLVGSVSTINLIGTYRASKRPEATLSFVGPGDILRISGRIDAMFTARIQKALEERPVDVVEIDSLGGDIAAAESAGKLLNARGVIVRINGRCASACVLFWASASRREAVASSYVGLHRSHLGDGREATGPLGAALFQRQMRSIAALDNAGFPRWLINRAMAQPPDQVQWYSVSDLRRIGVKVIIVPHPDETSALQQERP